MYRSIPWVRAVASGTIVAAISVATPVRWTRIDDAVHGVDRLADLHAPAAKKFCDCIALTPMLGQAV
jgi:hypothetical protein